MDPTKGPSSPDQPGFNSNLKPVRRRLQKFTPKAKIFGGKRSSNESGGSNGDSGASREMSTIRRGLTTTGSLNHNLFADEPLSLPPDLSDAKWLDYIERSGLMAHEMPVTESLPKPMRKKPPPIVPELSHLGRSDVTRSSLDSASSGSVPTSTSTSSTMRRQANTPVFRIGQLEGNKSRRAGDRTTFGRDPWIAQKTSSVELIAEQYCAFLEHRDALKEERERRLEGGQDKLENDAASSIYAGSSIHTANRHELATFRPHSPLVISREHVNRESLDETPVNIILEPVRSSTLITQHSPTSTDGTYVGSDENAIYFKPVALPCRQSTHSTYTTDYPSAPVDDNQIESADSLSLHICLDLLIKELSSTFTDRSRRTGDPSALQLWVMIEAYERLQNRIACMDELSESHRRNVHVMLQSWLGTLYAVHDFVSSKPAIDERLVERLSEDVD